MFAREIEGDLLLRGLDYVEQWWRWLEFGEGSMTSRKLLNVIVALSEDDTSATAKAMREGDWSHDQYVSARVANELMLSRADFAASHDIKLNPALLESPAQIEQRQAERDLQTSLHAFLHAQMTGKLVMPARGRAPMVVEDGALRP